MVYDGIYSLLNDAIDSPSTLYWNLAVILELWQIHIRYCMPQHTVTLHWMGNIIQNGYHSGTPRTTVHSIINDPVSRAE